MRRFGFLLLAAPVIIAVSGAAGLASHKVIARIHPTVTLAVRVAAEEQGSVTGLTVESEAFRAGKQSPEELYKEANALTERFRFASACFGVFMGLVVCGRLIRLSTIRKSNDYVIDRGACLSCARCFAYCPIEVKNAEEKAH